MSDSSPLIVMADRISSGHRQNQHHANEAGPESGRNRDRCPRPGQLPKARPPFKSWPLFLNTPGFPSCRQLMDWRREYVGMARINIASQRRHASVEISCITFGKVLRKGHVHIVLTTDTAE